MINNNEKIFKNKKQLPNFDLIKSQQFNNFFQPYIFFGGLMLCKIFLNQTRITSWQHL